jgi:hypothetical protein
MDGEAIRKLLEASDRRVRIEEHHGRLYEVQVEQPLVTMLDPEPVPLQFESLSAFAAYVLTNKDLVDAVMVIVAADSVRLVGPLLADGYMRFCYAQAKANSIQVPAWMDQEQLIIWLETCCVRNEARDKLMKLCSTVAIEDSATFEDRGGKQAVSVKKGVTLKEWQEIENPYLLAPFRTFREVEQPASAFVVRAKRGSAGPLFGLFPADGDAWRLDAEASAAKWLRHVLGDDGNVIVLGGALEKRG